MTILFVIYNANSFIMIFFPIKIFIKRCHSHSRERSVTILFYAPYESKLFHPFGKERIPVKGCNMPLKDIPELKVVIGECVIMTY